MALKSNHSQHHLLKRKCGNLLTVREKRLPESDLKNYLNLFLKKKEAFLKSVNTFGTPHYFFDSPALAAKIELFRQTFSSKFKKLRIFYAMKSNSFSGICRQIVDAGLGIDVSSGVELDKALKAGCRNIIFSGPGKTDEELDLALKHNKRVTVQMDSRGEFNRLTRLITEKKRKTTIAAGIRISPDPTEEWSKFGVPLKEACAIFQDAVSAGNIAVAGFQFHKSWNLNPDAHVAMIETIGNHIKKNLPENLWGQIRFLDIGGGFWPESGEWLNPENTVKGSLIRLVDPKFKFNSIFHYRKAKPLESFSKAISAALLRQGPPLSEVELWTEPGRWISNSAMHILLKVMDVKGNSVAITDGGTNLLGWERPLTEFIPLINLTRPSLHKKKFKIFGSLCTPQDVWGNIVFGEDVRPGDILLVPDQGAYTYSLRQEFIKPVASVIQYDGDSVEEVC